MNSRDVMVRLPSRMGLALLASLWFILPPAHSASATILITAVYYRAYAPGQADEAFRLANVNSQPAIY
jgi:hypothetical protein